MKESELKEMNARMWMQEIECKEVNAKYEFRKVNTNKWVQESKCIQKNSNGKILARDCNQGQ